MRRFMNMKAACYLHTSILSKRTEGSVCKLQLRPKSVVMSRSFTVYDSSEYYMYEYDVGILVYESSGVRITLSIRTKKMQAVRGER